MGQYVQAGICYTIKVSKKEMEQSRVNFEEVKDGLAKVIQIDLYEIKEVENGYVFSLKDEVLANKELPEFLMDQYKLLNADKEKSQEIIDNLKQFNKAHDIIEFAERKRYQNFQYSNVYDNIYCTMWEKRMMVEYETIIFLLEGKIIMESYRNFLRYIENLIKKDNPYMISKAVKVFIE